MFILVILDLLIFLPSARVFLLSGSWFCLYSSSRHFWEILFGFYLEKKVIMYRSPIMGSYNYQISISKGWVRKNNSRYF
jgi:hypothetical protein